MPSIIAFKATAAPLLAGAKTETRRIWTGSRFSEMERLWEMGSDAPLIPAYDRSPRHGGRKVALLRQTSAPEWTSLQFWPHYEDVCEPEGLRWMAERGLLCDGKEPELYWYDLRDTARRQKGPDGCFRTFRFEVVEQIVPVDEVMYLHRNGED